MTRFTRILKLDVVDSTNRYVVTAALAGEPEGLVVVADEQTHGRGRLGRTWSAPRGEALLCSMLFRPLVDAGDFHLVPTVVALAGGDAAQALSGCPIGLKWPNDLVAGDRKLGGILAEVVKDETTDSIALVVGIGVNLVVSDALSELVADGGDRDSLAITGLSELARHAVSRDELLTELLAGVESRYLTIGDQRAAIMDEYRARCSTIGQDVRVTSRVDEFQGRAVAIAEDGRLEVERDGTVIVLDAGDVTHLRVV